MKGSTMGMIIIVLVSLLIMTMIFATVQTRNLNKEIASLELNIRCLERQVNNLEKIKVLYKNSNDHLLEENEKLKECHDCMSEQLTTIKGINSEESQTKEETNTTANVADKKDAATYIAQTVWAEARGCSKTEQAAVIWCILNRVDAGYGDIISVITAPNQFAYHATNPCTSEHYNLALDVLDRWEQEKAGVDNVGRVLPKSYLWFHGDGLRNHFRNAYKNGTRWDWSLPSPY